jgi:hypothetical protein
MKEARGPLFKLKSNTSTSNHVLYSRIILCSADIWVKISLQKGGIRRIFLIIRDIWTVNRRLHLDLTKKGKSLSLSLSEKGEAGGAIFKQNVLFLYEFVSGESPSTY